MAWEIKDQQDKEKKILIEDQFEKSTPFTITFYIDIVFLPENSKDRLIQAFREVAQAKRGERKLKGIGEFLNECKDRAKQYI